MKKKTYLSVFMALVLILFPLLFDSCNGNYLLKGGSRIQKNNSKTDSNTEKINITFAQWSIPSSTLIEDKINQFNKTNTDNIHVNILNIPLDRYIETLNMLNASGDGPDVYEGMKEWLNSYIIKGWAADLSKYVDRSFFKGFPSWAVDLSKDTAYNLNGFYSIPSSQITYRLIYNKDLFKEAGLNLNAPPRTLSSLVKYAKQISDSEQGQRKYGIAMPMGETWIDFVQPMEALNCYSGVYFYNFNKGIYDLSVYEPWLKALKDLNENGGLFPGMEFMRSNQAIAQFAEGNVGMMYASSWEASLLSTQFTPKCNWGVGAPPTIDNSGVGKGKIKIDTAGWNIVNSNTEHIEAAVKLWKYLYSSDYLRELYDNNCMIPIMSNIMANSKQIHSSENLKAFLPNNDDSIYPNTPLTMEEWSRKNLYLSIINENQKSSVLQNESSRLNALLNDDAPIKLIDMSKFYFPKFIPENPMKFVR